MTARAITTVGSPSAPCTPIAIQLLRKRLAGQLNVMLATMTVGIAQGLCR